ncbi:Protein of unknown function DUF2179 [Paenibacillus curdlanolyticus YK9]|uniref:DUF2179 domain-containing protein n=1 Tax=Paenibacillus curdlanolyticus YK9 TaxID=717606 RepID=E0IEB2_9BACL|nr:YitT family protein [Paenibacillus curdlanolyticus]EFM09000.1 Protein of unknown function DUF2179 [Paenibacillus curdlanolyticus YK9]
MNRPASARPSRQRRRIGTPSSPRAQAAWGIAMLLAGAFIIAASFNLFLVPNGIASGGVSGLSIIVKQTLGIQPAFTQWTINIPLFFAGLWLLGRRFAAKTLLGSVVLPLFVLLTAHWPPPTDNPLLAAVYGGVGVGLGLGLVFRGRGSTGGTDLAAQILHKYTGISLGLTVVIFDGLVIALAGILISPENALYALIALFVTSKTIDLIQTGLALSKVAFIISDRTEELADAVLTDLDRGLTELDAHGGYTGQRRTVLMVVVSQNEVPKLKALVRSVDPGAFVIISQTTEVLGQGFKVE